MRYVKWAVLALLVLTVAGFLHYTLPQRDIVRIVGVENRRIDIANNRLFWANPDSGGASADTRDVRFINTIRPGGGEMVYRNEDTGWGWPPYFKVNSSNLQTRAQDTISTAEAPRWVAIRHYGWRSELFSIFPNAVGLRAVEGPEVRLIGWFNIVFLTALGLFALWLARLWRRFWRRRIDPALEDVAEAWDAVDDRADAARGRLARWWRRLRG